MCMLFNLTWKKKFSQGNGGAPTLDPLFLYGPVFRFAIYQQKCYTSKTFTLWTYYECTLSELPFYSTRCARSSIDDEIYSFPPEINYPIKNFKKIQTVHPLLIGMYKH